MIIKHKILLFILILGSVSISAQEPERNNRLLMNIDFGGYFFMGELKDKWSIRQDVEPYSYPSDNHNINHSTSSFYFSIKPEFRFFNNKASVIAGIRYTRFNSDLEKDKYFHLRYKKEGTNTEFARVRSINETYDYIGIPVEIQYIPIQFRSVGFYVKIGSEFNFRVHSDMDMVFVNESMKQHQQEIFDRIGVNTNSFYSTLYSSTGVKFGKAEGVNFHIGVILPSFILSSNNSSLISHDNFGGVQCSLVIPFKKTNKQVGL